MSEADEFLLVVDDDGPEVVISFVGKMDFTTTAVLQECLDELGGRRVTLDLANVSVIDDSALWALATAWKRALTRGGEIVLRGMRDDQLEILNRSGLEEILALSDAAAPPR
jgi:anti-anti-sigma factor